VSFVHLHVHTPFSFLDGAARIRDLAEAAASMGMPALAMTDHDNLSASVQFHQACTDTGIRPITGAEVTLEGGFHITLLAKNSRGYAHLCRIITHGHLSQERLHPATTLETLEQYHEDLIALSGCRKGLLASHLRRRQWDEALSWGRRLKGVFGPERFFVELQNIGLPGGRALTAQLAELAQTLGVRAVATNDVHHLTREDFPIHDVLTCARTLTRLDDVHSERRLNAQCFLRSPAEMTECFFDYPDALRATLDIAAQCEPALRPGEHHLPVFETLTGETAQAMLHRLVWEGARRRYGAITPVVRQRLEYELGVISQLGFDDYFLIVRDLLDYADREGIRHAGRGSAADSAVAYCLGITSVDAVERGLLFERFMSLERAAMPDIDIDFEAEKRDDVMHYVLQKYGQEHVAGVATYNTFRARSTVRDLGKAMGLPPEEIDRLARHMPYCSAEAIEEAFDRYPELRDSGLPRERYEQLLRIAHALAGFPRHLSTHLGGLVITREPLLDLTPVQMAAKDIPVIQFDKDDIEDLGMVKLDLLCLRMLSAVETSVRLIRRREPEFDYDTLPLDDAETYERIAASDTVGMFQLESPAQKALHARLQPDRFEDLIASVALIRPGPISANMVDPYIARRQGREPVTYAHPALERILGKTYGVVLFQEQVIEIATAIGGFSPGEADKLRRAMTRYRMADELVQMRHQFIERARARGIAEDVAQSVYECIGSYAGYGFCEAHAAAFADTAYKTAYLLAHYPAEFYAALMSHQPMGFYPPNTLLWEAKRRGIETLGPDVNRSELGFTVEGGAIRVSLSQIRGMGASRREQIFAERVAHGPFRSFADFCRRVHPDQDLGRDLVLSGAFDSLCPDRRHLLWELGRVARDGGPERLDLPNDPTGPQHRMPDFTADEKWWHEFQILGLGLRRHPMEVLRKNLKGKGVSTIAEATQWKKGGSVRVAGLAVRPHRPPTRSGRTVAFFTLEDETGLMDVTVFESVYQRYGKPLFTRPAIVVTGRREERNGTSRPDSMVAMAIEELQFGGRAPANMAPKWSSWVA